MTFEVFTDGGYRMQSDTGAFAYIILENGIVITEDSGLVVNSTSNRCEYIAMIEALKAVKKYTPVVECHSDSQLLVRQLNGQYQVKNEKLKRLHSVIGVLVGEFDKVSFVWNGRDSNPWSQRCDRLCNIQLGDI